MADINVNIGSGGQITSTLSGGGTINAVITGGGGGGTPLPVVDGMRVFDLVDQDASTESREVCKYTPDEIIRMIRACEGIFTYNSEVMHTWDTETVSSWNPTQGSVIETTLIFTESGVEVDEDGEVWAWTFYCKIRPDKTITTDYQWVDIPMSGGGGGDAPTGKPFHVDYNAAGDVILKRDLYDETSEISADDFRVLCANNPVGVEVRAYDTYGNITAVLRIVYNTYSGGFPQAVLKGETPDEIITLKTEWNDGYKYVLTRATK